MNFFSKTKNIKVLKKHNVTRFITFLLGCFIIASAYNIFLTTTKIVPGGVGGIAIILNKIIEIDNAIIILAADIVLLTLSYFILGKEKTRNSILGSLLFPLAVYLTENINVWLEIDTSQMLLSAVFGGVCYGFGAGLVFKSGFTTGGTDILNQIISKYFKITIGKSMLVSDGLIVCTSAFVFGPIHLMYSIIVLYIISLLSDKVILGISDNKAFYIITNEEEKVKDYILKYLSHGVTILKAKGGYLGEKENVLMCVLPTKDYYKLTEGIKEIDEDAFFLVTDAYEVFGGD